MRHFYIVCVFMLLLPCCVVAQRFMVDSICYNVTSEQELTCEVTFHDNGEGRATRDFYKDVVFVPDSVSYNGKEYRVTAIGDDAFGRSNELLSVVLPNSIVSIKNSAFSWCPKFKSITIPASVEFINNWAFISMPSLSYINVEEGNPVFDSREGCNAIIRTKTNNLLVGCKNTIIPDGIKVISDGAFISCFAMPQEIKPFGIVIPKSVEVIEKQAFTGCNALESVTLNEGLKKIGYRAFNATGIVSLTIPASVTEIDEEAFRACDSLKSLKVKKGNRVYDSRGRCNAIIESETDRLVVGCSVSTIPDGVRSIGLSAFSCSAIKQVVFPKTLEMIEANAFFDCRKLKSVVVPGNVKEIGFDAFTACAMEELVVENGVEVIGAAAFSSCSALRRAVLPASLTRIGGSLFRNCSRLEWVDLDNENEHFYCNGYVLVDKKERTLIDGWGMDVCYASNGYRKFTTRKIVSRAFEGHKYISTLVLPESVGEIESKAFYSCNGLRTIECRAMVPPLLGDDVFAAGFSSRKWALPLQERVVVVVPKGALDAYRNAPGWKDFKHMVEN